MSKPVTPEAAKGQSKYGSTTTRGGLELVRLEEVHAWLMSQKRMPAKDATYQVFSTLIDVWKEADERGNNEAVQQLQSLHLLKAIAYPAPIMASKFRGKDADNFDEPLKAPSLNFGEAWVEFSTLPDLRNPHFDDDSTFAPALLETLGDAALRVWRGSADISTDPLEVRARQRAAIQDPKFGIEWPSDDDLSNLLARLAIGKAVALELWGFVTAEVKTLRSVTNSESDDVQASGNAETQTLTEPKTYKELVNFRTSEQGEKSSFSSAQKKILATEVDRRNGRLGAKGVASGVAKELNISVSRLNRLIRTKDQEGKREKKAKKAA